MRYLIITVLLLIPGGSASAQTVPPSDPLYRDLGYFRDRGRLNDVFYNRRPFSLTDLSPMADMLQRGDLSAAETAMLLRIARFCPPQKMRDGSALTWGGYLRPVITSEGADVFSNIRFGVRLPHGVSLATSYIIQNDQPSFSGRTYAGANLYNDQSTLLLERKYGFFKIGRDYLQTGPGQWGQLLFSDVSPAYDHYMAGLGNDFIAFSFWGIQLNDRRVSDSDSSGLSAAFGNYERFVNAHRLSLRPVPGVELGATEAVIYGGPGETWQLPFLNPVMFYHGHAINRNTPNTNTLVCFDADWQVLPSWRVWGELLVDDYQVDAEDSWDLEPGEIGFTLGSGMAGPFGWKGAAARLEFSQVRNRTYNTPVNDWEKFLHYGQPIGYEQGNDVQSFAVQLNSWWQPWLRTELEYRLIRKGEGRINGVFNTDFLDTTRYTIETGYDEPIPSGVIETTNRIGLQADLFYGPYLRACLFTRLDLVRNKGNVAGADEPAEFQIGLDITAELVRWWRPASR